MDFIRSHEEAGLLARGMASASAALLFSQATAVLAGQEANAVGLSGAARALGLAALFFVVLGYMFLIVTAGFAIGAVADREHAWIVVLGLAALMRFGGAVSPALLARSRVSAPNFGKPSPTW